MLQAGIVDPAKVVRVALQDAAPINGGGLPSEPASRHWWDAWGA